MSNLEDWYEGLQVFKGSLPTANIGGGVANQLLVQTAPGVTSFITPPTSANTFLEWDGSNFGYASISANTRTASLTLYQWASTTPTAFPSGTSVYTWATSAFTLPATLNGWSALPATPVAGQKLYACSVRYVDNTVNLTSTITWNTSTAYVVGAAGVDGVSGVTGIVTNDSFTLPADNTGVVTVYTNSGTDIHIYDGSTELTYDGSGLSTGRWKVTAVGTNINAGTITANGIYATVGIANTMSNSSLTASILYTISGVNLAGATFSFTKIQTFTKAVAGAPGTSGSAMNILPDRATAFTSTDGNLDAGQSNVILTANLQNITSPTIVWTFTGFQTSPTSSGTVNQTITSAQFGTAKSATVTCTVNGTYTDTVTFVRLEKSTAAAGATVGATWGANINGQPANSQIYNSNVSIGANGALSGAGGGQVTIGGLGYSGDLNATYGAAFGTNISGQITPSNYTTFVSYGAFTAVGFSQSSAQSSASVSVSITVTHGGNPVLIHVAGILKSNTYTTTSGAISNCWGTLSSSTNGTLINGQMGQIPCMSTADWILIPCYFQYTLNAPTGTTSTYTFTMQYSTTGNGTSGYVGNPSISVYALKR